MSFDETVIKVENLSKCYQIYDKPRDRLLQMFARGKKKYFREFWAVRDLSFEIRKGETVGIVGRNGSGKSTLLQLICGTLNPTTGSIETKGRVAALLELGAGFNPEFSGRENISLSASLYGLTPAQVAAHFDDIIAFADIGQFIDQPVKTYSSGMYVRLAFAIAINVQPDILIVDEALAVGDLAFQAKCMARLQALMNAGTTVLFVSHDLSSIRNLCKKVIWLRNGQLVRFGLPEETIGGYVAEMHMAINSDIKATCVDGTEVSADASPSGRGAVGAETEFGVAGDFVEGWRRYGDGRAEILKVLLLNSHGLPADNLFLHEAYTIRFLVRAYEEIVHPAFGFTFRDLKGNQVIGGVTTNFPEFGIPEMQAGKQYVIDIKGVNSLSQGVYTLNLGIESVTEKNKVHEFIDVVENVKVFKSSYGDDPVNIFPAMVWQSLQFSVAGVDSI